MTNKEKIINRIKDNKVVIAELGTKLEAYFYDPKVAESAFNSHEWANEMMDKGYTVTFPGGVVKRVEFALVQDAPKSKCGKYARYNRHVYTAVSGVEWPHPTLSRRVWRPFN